jgi:DNA-binding Xre family transcriptional regulator
MKMWEKLAKAMKAAGTNQKQLGASLGLSENRITKWKDKPKNFSVLDLAKLARALGVPVGYLIDDTFDHPWRADEPWAAWLNEAQIQAVRIVRARGLSLDEVIRAFGESTTIAHKTPDEVTEEMTRIAALNDALKLKAKGKGRV